MLFQTLTTACALMGLRPLCPPAAIMMAESPAWLSLLDELPVFAVANKEGKPLQYEVGGKPQAIFYADLLAAKKQLEDAQGANPDLKVDLIPVGLGAAYSLSLEGKASLVPGVTELTACGMPEGLPALGQELPLFACMEMTREAEGGGTELPLFMSVADCEAAVKQAREEADREDLEITPLSLPSVVEHIESSATPNFGVIPPTASTDHIAKYVGNIDGQFVYARVVEED